MRAEGIIFDKDGTLFDFQATWAGWAMRVFDTLAAGDAAALRRIAAAADYDLGARRFRPDSVMIAGTNREAAECVARALPGADVGRIEALMSEMALDSPLAPAVPLGPLLGGLAGRGLTLGLVTNDTEAGARAHLRTAGVLDRFAFVAGFDSGHGAKPAPDPLLAFARATGLVPARVVMVGDSRHDLVAGRAAGMQTVGVLTGPAAAEDLAPEADVILPDIGHLPDWLAEVRTF